MTRGEVLMVRVKEKAKIEAWEPGNGTRYELSLVPLDRGGWLFAWPNAPGGGRSMRIPRPPAWLNPGYVAEKMGLRMGPDVLALLAWLADRLPEEVEVEVGSRW